MANTEDKNLDAETALESEEMNESEARIYELGFHLDGELPQEEARKAYESLKDVIAKNGTIIAEGAPEKIQLAYTISRMETTGRRDFNSAFFCWIAYEADTTQHAAIIAAAHADKRMVRFIDLKTTKEAAQHASEMHEFYREMPEGPAEEEVPAEAELDAALKEAGVTV